MRRIQYPILLLTFLLSLTGCQKFIFGDISVSYENNPLEQKKTPRTGADLYEAPRVTTPIANPDPDGALKDWATCLVMLKEGHPHGGGKLHGNFVYDKAPWRQEEFVVIHNTPSGQPSIEVLRSSTATYAETLRGAEGPDYLRVIGGKSKLWGLCLYFFDKEGKRINDRIYKMSDRYQIFYTVSDIDSIGRPYEVMDVRYNGDKDPQTGAPIVRPVPSEFFADKGTFEARAAATPEIFRYIYRDTWTEEDMSDGVRELFNIRLLPPLGRNDERASAPYDQDCVGLKGHFLFESQVSEGVDARYAGTDKAWPITLTDGRPYTRSTYLLPQFFLSIRVMKCPEGNKVRRPMLTNNAGEPMGFSKLVCDPYYAPDKSSGWEEVTRFNIPLKVYTNAYDSDPTHTDPNEPYYFHLGLEIGLSPTEAYKAVSNLITHGSGGAGYGAWFL